MTLVPKAETSRAGLCTGTEIPFSDNEKWRGEPVTEADTDIGRVTLWWDTGAPSSVLRKEIIHNTESGDTLTSTRLELGARNFGPWQFELWGEMNLPGFDGFLGSDFFAKHVVCVDFPRDRVVVVSPTAKYSRTRGLLRNRRSERSPHALASVRASPTS